MAIVVEDGTGLSNSNSYVTEAEVNTWASDRGITISGTVSQLIYKAMDYLETLEYIGDKQTEAQALQWPRDNVYIDDFYIEPTTIPQEIKDAEMSLCMSIDAGVDPMDTICRATKKEKVGEIEVEYMDNASSRDIISSVNRLLRKLLKDGSSGTAFKVSRG